MDLKFYSHVNGNSVLVESNLIDSGIGFEIVEGITQCGYKPETLLNFNFANVVLIASNSLAIKAMEQECRDECIKKILYIYDQKPKVITNKQHDIVYFNKDEFFVSDVLYRRKIITRNKKITLKKENFFNKLRRIFTSFNPKTSTLIVEMLFSAEKPSIPFSGIEVQEYTLTKRDLIKIALSGVTITKGGRLICKQLIQNNAKLKKDFLTLINVDYSYEN